jgi:Electron transfer flavoprotein, alpha subunit
MTILVLAEHAAGKLTQATHRLLGVVKQWQQPVHLCIAATAETLPALIADAVMLEGVEQMLTAASEQLLWPEPAVIAGYLKPLIPHYQIMAAPHQQDLLAAFALLSGSEHLPLLTDVVGFKCSDEKPDNVPDQFLTAYYDQQAWRWFHHAVPSAKCLLLTVQTGRFSTPTQPNKPAGTVLSVQELATAISSNAAVTQDFTQASGEGLRLDEAKIVIGGGRPLGKRFMPVMKPLATLLSAAIGATRGAVDAGFVPFTSQIGQTGSHIAPELYIAVGLSGAPQHIAGIGQSRVIVAINKDISAPICQQADYILQGDMFELLPALCDAIRAQRSAQQTTVLDATDAVVAEVLS